MTPLNSSAFAAALDTADPNLAASRSRFHLPPMPGAAPPRPAVYLCGNSLGLQPKTVAASITRELDKWASLGVEGHFTPPLPWASVEDAVVPGLAAVVGATPAEVAVMGSLTGNLHCLFAAFYRPTASRNVILIEKGAFPSDRFAVLGQLALHSVPASVGLVEVVSRAGGDAVVDEEDILAAVAAVGDRLAVALLPGVQFQTGTAFNISRLSAAVRGVGGVAGWDLAHAAGNLALSLHDDGADFAAWCSYKYLNSGPGGIAGLFVHERWHGAALDGAPLLAGWWGHDRSTRFAMGAQFSPQPGAARFQQSNPPVLCMVALACALAEVELAGGMRALRAKSVALTGYLEALLEGETALTGEVTQLTPKDPAKRGAQLSIAFATLPVRAVTHALGQEGVIVDAREPNIIRISPCPLYNTAEDCRAAVAALGRVVAKLLAEKSS